MKKKITQPKYHEPKEQKERHAHCSFCGGKGQDLRAEKVVNPITGSTYRVPLSHTSCKESILSLSLSLSLSSRLIKGIKMASFPLLKLASFLTQMFIDHSPSFSMQDPHGASSV